MKKKIFFADLTHTGIVINADNFPYGAGLVAAYAKQELGDDINISIFKFPEKLNKALKDGVPDVMCFSNYAWNENLTYAFVRYIKHENPNTIIVIGGPNFPIEKEERKSYLEEHPYIDFYIKWDGEIALTILLKELINRGMKADSLKNNVRDIGNVCFVWQGNYFEGPDQRVHNLNDMPSPYLTGMFDEFFDDQLTPIMETTRGCPYSCTFCNDGHLSRSKIFRKSDAFIFEELEYMAQRSSNAPQLMLTDLNFGMYKEDIVTSHTIKHMIDKYNWPERLETSTGKSQPKRLIESNNIINEGNAGILKLGYSFQSTSDDVVSQVKRRNLSLNDLLLMKESKTDAQKDNTEFFTELILGLPGDSKEHHYSSLKDVIDTLEMNNIDVHQLTLLKGSELGSLKSRQEFEFKIAYRVYVGCLGVYNIGTSKVPVAEVEEVAIQSNTMSFDEYMECRLMTLLVKIYIDHEPFRPVFNLVKRKNISSFEVLRLLREQYLDRYDSLGKLEQSFRDGSVKSLFDSYDECISFVGKNENINKYVNGELGQNELLVHRLLAYRDCWEDIHSALRDAVIAYLDSMGVLSDVERAYVNEATIFSKLKKFNPNEPHKTLEGEFTYNFIEASKQMFLIDPEKYKTDKVKYKFYYDATALSKIRSFTSRWGESSLYENAKTLQKGNLMSMEKTVEEIEII